MIIKIAQTASNIRQHYEISGKNFMYSGDLGRFRKQQAIILRNNRTELKAAYKLSSVIKSIPFRPLFNAECIGRQFLLYRNQVPYGRTAFTKHGIYKNYYIISLDTGTNLLCYSYEEGSFDYVSIYHGDKQIAQIETCLNVSDYKYTHWLYILDEYAYLADTLSLWTLYYANYRFVKRFHMSKTRTIQYARSLSRYKDKYDPTWRKTHFPDSIGDGTL